MSKVKELIMSDKIRDEEIKDAEMVYRMDQIAELERMLERCSDIEIYTKGRIKIVIDKLMNNQPVSREDQRFLRQL